LESLKIDEVCEVREILLGKVRDSLWLVKCYQDRDISAVEQKAKELQERVCHDGRYLDNVTAKNEEGSCEVNVKAAKGIERDIKDLLL
jgi:hypothetical protein